MSTWRGRVRRIERQGSGDPLDEGERLVPVVRGLAEDQLAWLAVVVRREHLELIDPPPSGRDRATVDRFLAGLTRSVTDGGPALAVGLAGNLQIQIRVRGREAGRNVPVAVAFLEAPDCDWWMWQRFLVAEPDAEPEQVLAGRYGDPLPSGLGRWWSLGRRGTLQVTLSRAEPAPPPVATSPLVH